MIKKPFERVSPESVGIRSQDVSRLLDRLSLFPAGQEPHHFLLIRHGKVAAEGHWAPYTQGLPHNLASVSKALTSTAVGFAVQEGLFHLDDKIVDLLPDKLPQELQPEMRNMTVKMLLEMGAGQECGDAHGGIKGEKRLKWQAKRQVQHDEIDLAKTFFTTELIYEPGTVFGYNGMCSYLLSLIVTRKSGMDMMDYLTPRLFEPLGIPTPYAQRDPLGICIGQGGVYLSVEELAAVGQFYLQKGMWEGKQLLSRQWIEDATAKHLPTKSEVGEDWSQGYCWQFWRGRHNTYRFCGAFGQMCVCMPDLDALFVIESGVDVDYMHVVLDAFYDTLIRNMAPGTLPEDAAALAILRQQCQALALAAPTSTPAAGASLMAGTWYFNENAPAQKAVLTFNGSAMQAELTLKNGTIMTLRSSGSTPTVRSIGLPNDSGASDDWATTAWFAEIGTLCFRTWELSGFGKIDLTFRLSAKGIDMKLIMNHFFVIDPSEAFWTGTR